MVETNHPRLIILDEPRQHEIEHADFARFLGNLTDSFDRGQQVIVATSEVPSSLKRMLAGRSYQLLNFDSKILRLQE